MAERGAPATPVVRRARHRGGVHARELTARASVADARGRRPTRRRSRSSSSARAGSVAAPAKDDLGGARRHRAGRASTGRRTATAPASSRVRIGRWRSGVYYARLDRRRRAGRLRAARRRPAQPRRAPRRRRHADEHLAGLQLPRRGRRRRRATPGTTGCDPRRCGSDARILDRGVPAALPPLRPAVPPLARARRSGRSTSSPTRTSSGLDGAALARARLRPDRLLRATTSTSRPHEYDVVERYREPRREPDLPLGQQLLLAGRAARPPARARRAVAEARPARGGARRRAVPGERRRRSTSGAFVVRDTPRPRLALRRHRPRRGLPPHGVRIVRGVSGSRSTRTAPTSPPGHRTVRRRDPEPVRPGLRRRR